MSGASTSQRLALRLRAVGGIAPQWAKEEVVALEIQKRIVQLAERRVRHALDALAISQLRSAQAVEASARTALLRRAGEHEEDEDAILGGIDLDQRLCQSIDQLAGAAHALAGGSQDGAHSPTRAVRRWAQPGELGTVSALSLMAEHDQPPSTAIDLPMSPTRRLRGARELRRVSVAAMNIAHMQMLTNDTLAATPMAGLLGGVRRRKSTTQTLEHAQAELLMQALPAVDTDYSREQATAAPEVVLPKFGEPGYARAHRGSTIFNSASVDPDGGTALEEVRRRHGSLVRQVADQLHQASVARWNASLLVRAINPATHPPAFPQSRFGQRCSPIYPLFRLRFRELIARLPISGCVRAPRIVWKPESLPCAPCPVPSPFSCATRPRALRFIGAQIQKIARGRLAREAVEKYLAAAAESRLAQLGLLRTLRASQLARLKHLLMPQNGERARCLRARQALSQYGTVQSLKIRGRLGSFAISQQSENDHEDDLGVSRASLPSSRRMQQSGREMLLAHARNTSLTSRFGKDARATQDTASERSFQCKIRTQRARFNASERTPGGSATLIQKHVRARADWLRMQLIDAELRPQIPVRLSCAVSHAQAVRMLHVSLKLSRNGRERERPDMKPSPRRPSDLRI
jgi:hypothetical protein